MKVAKILRNSVAGVLIAAMPITTTAAAVRPNAAVPTAGSTAVTAQGGPEAGFAAAWAALAIIALAIILMVWIMVDKDPPGRGVLSRA